MTDSEDKTDKDQEEEKGMLENLFTDGTPPVDPEKSTEEDPEVTHEADSEGYVPTETPTEDMSEVPEVIPAQDPLNEPSPEEAETVDESSESFLGETGYAPTEEPSPETFRHAVGDPADPSEEYMAPQAPVRIPRSGFGEAVRHPGFIIATAAVLAFAAGRAVNYFLPKTPKKIDETHEAGVTLDNEELNNISSKLELLKTDFDGYQALAAMHEIKTESQIESLEKSLNALEGSRESSAVVSREEIDAMKEQIREGKIDSDGYLGVFRMFEKQIDKMSEELKQIKAEKALPGITPKETPKPEKPVVPKEKPTEEDVSEKSTDDDKLIQIGLLGRIVQYRDSTSEITEDNTITPLELAKFTEKYRTVSRLIRKNQPFYGGLPRDSKTIKTLENISNDYKSVTQQIILANEKIKHDEKYNNVVLKINIDRTTKGAKKAQSTGWMDLKIPFTELQELDSNVYFTALANYTNAKPVLRRDGEAGDLLYKLLEHGKIFKQDHEFKAGDIGPGKITGVAIRMTSPDGVELIVKELEYNLFENEFAELNKKLKYKSSENVEQEGP